MITAKQMYEVALNVSGERERNDKEFKMLISQIEDRAKLGGFFIYVSPISEENVNKLRTLGFNVEDFRIDPYTPWSTTQTYISWYND